jgi:deazaflavin-dependent oxidoreductase (nitroreductase family)
VSDDAMNDWNAKIIAEFRENGGKVGGPFEGAPMVLVHHWGAKSGVERVTPLMYRPDGDRIVIFGSKAGAPTHPDWFHNLRAHPDITIEVGEEVDVPAHATVLEGEERDRIWEDQKRDVPQFAGYEETAQGRTIPVIALERRDQ